MNAVLPCVPSTQESIRYTLEEANPLMTVDCRLHVENVIFANWPSIVTHLTRIRRTYRWLLLYLVMLGSGLQLCVLVVDATRGRLLAPFSFLFVCIPTVLSLLTMRYDILCLLVHTYEFWYISTINVFLGVLMGMMYGDCRCILVVSVAFANACLLMIDAHSKASRDVVTAGCILLFCLTWLMVVQTFHLHSMETTSEILFSRNGWTLRSDQLIINFAGTLGVMCIRNSYRKWTYTREQRDIVEAAGTVTVRCISYYTPIRFCETPSTKSLDNTENIPNNRSQLKVVSVIDTIDAQEVWNPIRISLKPFSRWIRVVLQIIAIVSIISSVISIILITHTTLSIFAVSGTILYCGHTLLYLHRTIFSRLARSFDYAFITIQIVLADVAIATILRWDARSIVILAKWIWFMWLVTIDALTPVIKRKLGITPVLLFFIGVNVAIMQLHIMIQMIWLNGWNIDDVVLLHLRLPSGHTVTWTAVSFLFARMVTLCLSSIRLCYRLYHTMYQDILVVLYAPVEYVDKNVAPKRRRRDGRSTATSSSITPK